MSAPSNYRIRQEIARGGMGAVLDAEDTKLGRAVAMKVILNPAAGEQDRQRFLLEARVLGQLPHPNIVPIYDKGTDEQGREFYTMKLVQGHTLHEILKQIRSGDPEMLARHPLSELLTIFRKVCDAVAFAHSRGIIHRDLKPQNIMVGEFGEVLLMDWGLAKILSGAEAKADDGTDPDPSPSERTSEPATGLSDDTTPTLADADADAATIADGDAPTVAETAAPGADAKAETVVDAGADTIDDGDAEQVTAPANNLVFQPKDTELPVPDESCVTLEGTVMGTPQFMPPEQAEGLIGALDARSDIYSLGAILYNILTLRLPVSGTSMEDVLSKVLSGSIVPPTEYNPKRKGMRSLRRRRDAAAEKIRPPTEFTLAHCPGGRVPDALSAVAMKALQFEPDDRFQTVTELSQDIEAYQGGFATSAEEAGAVRLIRLFIERNKTLAVAACLTLLLTLAFLAKVISSERRAVRNAQRAETERNSALAAHQEAEEKGRLAAKNEREARAAEQKAREALAAVQVEKLRADDKAREAEANRLKTVAALATAKEQEQLARSAAAEAQSANAVAQTQKARADQSAARAQEALKAANRQRLRAEKGERDQIRNLFESYLSQGILQAANGDFAAARIALGRARDTARPIDGESVVAARRRALRNVVAWLTDLSGLGDAATYRGASTPLKSVAYSPEQNLLVAGGEDGSLFVFPANAPDSRPFAQSGHLDIVTRLEFFPGGALLASAGADRMIRLFAVAGANGEENGSVLRQLWSRQTAAPAAALAVSPDGRFLACGNDDGDVEIFDPAADRVLARLQRHDGAVSAVRFSADGMRFASVSIAGIARLWTVDDHGEFKLIWTSRASEEPLVALAVNDDGTRLATGSASGMIRLYSPTAGARSRRLAGHRRAVTALELHDEKLVSASLDRTIRIWDIASGVTLRMLQGHATGVTALQRSARQLFSAGNDQTVRRWSPGDDGAAGAFHSIDFGSRRPNATALAPNNRTLAVGFDDGTLSLLALPDATPLWSTAAHATNVSRIAFHPSGNSFASAGFDGRIHVWDAASGKAHRLSSHGNHVDVVNDLAYSPDGRFLASASIGGRIRVVDGSVVSGAEQSGGRIGVLDLARNRFRSLAAHRTEVLAIDFNSDGSRLVSTGDAGATRLWKHVDGVLTPVRNLAADRDMIYAARFHPDGQRVVVGGRSGTVRILDCESGRELAMWAGHQNSIIRLEISPDGGQAYTVGADGTLRFWDLELGREAFLLPLPVARGIKEPMWDFSFRYHPDAGGRLAVPLTNGKVLLYRFGRLFER